MNAPFTQEVRGVANTATPTDAQFLALDAVLESASMLCIESAALIAAAAGADIAATEARLWTCRRVLTAAVASWREVIPAPSNHDAGGKNDA